MNLRDLEYLVALDEHRHFGRAAAACYASQPTLSTQLRKLEAELGVELIERNARNVLFTDIGEEVVERARRILAEAADIRGIARQAQDPYAGTLRLGLFPTLGPYLLPHSVPVLRRRLPNLEVLLVEEKSETLLSQLRSGSLDAAVLALPLDGEGLHVEPLFREDFVLAVAADHPLAASTDPVTMAELDHENLLLLTDGHCLRQQALDVCRISGAGEREGFQATSLETLRHMVAAGVGITLLPRLAVSEPVLPNPAIVVREFGEGAPYRDIAVCWRRSSVFRQVLPEVAEALREVPDRLVTPLESAQTVPEDVR